MHQLGHANTMLQLPVKFFLPNQIKKRSLRCMAWNRIERVSNSMLLEIVRFVRAAAHTTQPTSKTSLKDYESAFIF